MVKRTIVGLSLAAIASIGVVGCIVQADEPEEGLDSTQDDDENVGGAQEAIMIYTGWCPGNVTGYRGQNGTQISCWCGLNASGAMWGTGTYTDDSSLCAAARHAGVITSAGGSIIATISPGQSSYTGSTQNGLTSYSYGSWSGSVTVSSPSSLTACPPYMAPFRGQNGKQTVCTCSASATNTGSLWGTNTYTDDCNPCRAAVHAGAITTAGGDITVVIAPGQSSYVGSTQNGITSYSYGSYSGSETITPPP
jgi:hypothetical protein